MATETVVATHTSLHTIGGGAGAGASSAVGNWLGLVMLVMLLVGGVVARGGGVNERVVAAWEWVVEGLERLYEVVEQEMEMAVQRVAEYSAQAKAKADMEAREQEARLVEDKEEKRGDVVVVEKEEAVEEEKVTARRGSDTTEGEEDGVMVLTPTGSDDEDAGMQM